jgi:hypothetical protein
MAVRPRRLTGRRRRAGVAHDECHHLGRVVHLASCGASARARDGAHLKGVRAQRDAGPCVAANAGAVAGSGQVVGEPCAAVQADVEPAARAGGRAGAWTWRTTTSVAEKAARAGTSRGRPRERCAQQLERSAAPNSDRQRHPRVPGAGWRAAKVEKALVRPAQRRQSGTGVDRAIRGTGEDRGGGAGVAGHPDGEACGADSGLGWGGGRGPGGGTARRCAHLWRL